MLPLAFWYSSTILLKAASSSGTKPWVHHTVAVLAAALAMKGRASVPAAATASELRRTDRLVMIAMPISFPSRQQTVAWRSVVIDPAAEYRAGALPAQLLLQYCIATTTGPARVRRNPAPMAAEGPCKGPDPRPFGRTATIKRTMNCRFAGPDKPISGVKSSRSDI